ncbi:hypothetical protein QFC19_009186 [Naganishia cerealis]|uniref:Uncharacterized protein n=1 Tax=Naganishia cerealis TaxID=610337 RepID=A0ACC2UXD0_9TREE|nr:hypothetical protein QFC19_009186 [Naganishia cerealis]
MLQDWQLGAAAAKARTEASIPPALRISTASLPSRVTDLCDGHAALTPLDREIIQHDATDLRDRLASRLYTAVQVAQAYIKSASLAHQATNCLTDFFPEEALQRAAWLDEQYEISQGPIGPLHGVPISVKDQIDIAGKDSPAGFLSQVGKNIAVRDAHVIEILRSAGAVFYCKTTLPQAIMHLETDSYLACGVYGFKPTAGILPLIGFRNHGCILGVDRVPPTQGPMGRSIRDLELYMQVVLAAKPSLRDPSLFPFSLGNDAPPKRIRVGWFLDDGVVTPTAPIRRGIEAAVSALKGCADIELVEFLPIEPEESWDIAASIKSDSFSRVYSVERTYLPAPSGEPVLDLSEWIVSQASSEPVTLQEYSALMLRRLELRNRVAAQWLSAGIDILVCPAGPSVAPKLNTARYWNYTSYWNLVNYPAMVIPTGLYVDGKLDGIDQPRTSFRNEQDRYNASCFDLEASEGVGRISILIPDLILMLYVLVASNKRAVSRSYLAGPGCVLRGEEARDSAKAGYK